MDNNNHMIRLIYLPSNFSLYPLALDPSESEITGESLRAHLKIDKVVNWEVGYELKIRGTMCYDKRI